MSRTHLAAAATKTERASRKQKDLDRQRSVARDAGLPLEGDE